MAPSGFVVVGGATGHGKSLLVSNLCVNAIRNGLSVGFISTEMTRQEVFARFLAIVSGCSVRRLEPGTLFQQSTATEAVEVWRSQQKARWWFDNGLPHSVRDVATSLKSMAVDHKCKVLVVDYVQDVGLEIEHVAQRSQTVAQMLKRCARTFHVIVVGVSQFNRGQSFTARKDSPVSEGLAGGQWENSADQVILLDQSSYEKADYGTKAHTRILLKKNRHGPTAEIPVTWDYDNLRLSERSAVPDPRSSYGDRS